MLKKAVSSNAATVANATAKSAVKKSVAGPAKTAVAKKSVTRAATKVAKTDAIKVTSKGAPTQTVKKAAGKPVVKTAGRRVAGVSATSAPVSPAKSAKVAGNPAAEAPKGKIKKAKLVRDSFTMPESEYRILNDVKKAFLKSGIAVKKSELLRAGVALLSTTSQDQLRIVIAGLPALKAGRPKKDK